MKTPDTKKPKIAVLHDSFLYRGGGERLVTLMAKSLGADLISGFFSEGSFDPRELGFEGAMIALGKPVFAKGIRHLTLIQRFRKKAKMLREYDIVILSGNCLDALRHIREDAKVYYYCHTPPRYLFDFREIYVSRFPAILHPFINRVFDYQAKRYIQSLDRFDTIFTNSKNTHDRLLHFCQKESTILYPPTDTERFRPASPQPSPKGEGVQAPSPFPEGEGARGWGGSYYLSCSRLSPPKRVDLVVRAFQALPEKNLVFTYGANDPEKERILTMCEWYTNIFPIPAPKDNEFIALVAGAIANIYIPVDEDFGMTPVESMSCGVPVIGVAEGWLLETVIEGKTGKLIKIVNNELWIANLKQVIQDTSEEEWESMKDDCRKRAEDFSLCAFADHLKNSIYA
jgi:glycosyltransferase involved in cell wall biosynthesis